VQSRRGNANGTDSKGNTKRKEETQDDKPSPKEQNKWEISCDWGGQYSLGVSIFILINNSDFV
jgi:hypothetical protein